MKILTMPSFGSDMARGMVAQWKVKPGDEVHKGDIIATIETMKGLIDMEVFDEGCIARLLVPEGQEIKVGVPIAELRLPGDPVDSIKSNDEPPPEVSPESTVQSPSTTVDKVIPVTVPPTGEKERVRISPIARRLAEKRGLDWHTLPPGAGPLGAVQLRDIEALSGQSAQDETSPPADKPGGMGDPALLMRQAIASVVSKSKREIPHYYLEQDMALDSAESWLAGMNKDKAPGDRVLIDALLYVAIARALKLFPEFNGVYQRDHFQAAENVHLGNAISLRSGGLVVAAIHDADKLGVAAMMQNLKDQVIRAREGGLRMSEMQDATVTISNLGERGTDRFQGVIFPPQVALIGIGRVRRVPWLVDDKIQPMTISSISLAADHRVTDGHTGARFLNKINKLLQKPEQLT